MKRDIKVSLVRSRCMNLFSNFYNIKSSNLNKSYFKMQKTDCTNLLLIDIHATSPNAQLQYKRNESRIFLL